MPQGLNSWFGSKEPNTIGMKNVQQYKNDIFQMKQKKLNQFEKTKVRKI